MEQNGIITSVIKQLKNSQEKVEIRAIDAINQQDKVCCLLRDSEERTMELITNFEAVCYELEMITSAIDEKYGDVMEEEDISRFTQLFDVVLNQGNMIQELSRVFQKLIEEGATTKEAVLSMEEEIASHRDTLDQTEEVLFNLKEGN